MCILCLIRMFSKHATVSVACCGWKIVILNPEFGLNFLYYFCFGNSVKSDYYWRIFESLLRIEIDVHPMVMMFQIFDDCFRSSFSKKICFLEHWSREKTIPRLDRLKTSNRCKKKYFYAFRRPWSGRKKLNVSYCVHTLRWSNISFFCELQKSKNCSPPKLCKQMYEVSTHVF